MKTILQVLSDKVSEAFILAGYSDVCGIVTVSDRPDLCQFQCNSVFTAAKKYKKSPQQMAAEIIELLRKNVIFSKVELAGAGFINMTITDSFLVEFVSMIFADENLGIPQAEANETIVLDYGGPNVAKPLHIGHLRSAIIGESLKRIIKATGRNVVSDVHLGDWGLQIGLVIAELEERNPWKCFSDDYAIGIDDVPKLSIRELNDIYPFASKKSKENDTFKERSQEITAKLQKGHPGYLALWKEIIRVSVSDIKEIYQKLNVEFDYWYGESDSEKYVDKLIDILSIKGLLYESDGASVVDVSEINDSVEIPPVIIKKSNDSNMYATTDLATILQRQSDFKPQQIWYVVDNRQSLHFVQVFRCAKKAGLIPETTNLEHLGFGTMNGSDGKPYKTRDGGVMPLLDFFNSVYEAVYQRICLSEFSADQVKADAAEKITVAAIKFGDLINHRSKDYIFNLDKFLASEGKTGAFLLFTVARINSILRKVPMNETLSACALSIYSELDRDLLMIIALSGEAFLHAFTERAPSCICENAYRLASAFSKFYHYNHIISESSPEIRRAWLNLCIAVKVMLIKHLDVLGIEAVEFM